MTYRQLFHTCCTAALLASSPALADHASTPSIPAVYDSSSKLVGTAIAEYIVKADYNGSPYLLVVFHSKLSQNALFYYTTSNCTGQPYLYTDDFYIQYALWDELTETVWSADTAASQMISPHSYEYGNPRFCQTNYSQTIPAAPAIDIDRGHFTRTLQPPFVARDGAASPAKQER
jgi:hypothetical protein